MTFTNIHLLFKDAKYLGNIKKCEDENAVRCCGASGSFVVGKIKKTTEVPKEETTPIPATQSVILTRADADDIQANEISYEEGDILNILNDEFLRPEESRNLGNFHVHHLDEEAAESESVIKTANAEADKDGKSELETTLENATRKSHRMPKSLDDVVKVYPNIMSGIPKTTPKNLPETSEMKVFDREFGMDLHLVFSKTTSQPEPIEEVTPNSQTTLKPKSIEQVTSSSTTTLKAEPTEEVTSSSTADPTSKQPLNRFAQRRRQFRPATTKRVSTTESSVADLKSTTTTLRSRPRQRVRNFIPRQSNLESPSSTTRRPRVTATTTTAPTTEEKELLLTSEDDRSQPSRSRLFNTRRLNYLQRNTTPATTTDSSIETTTHQTNRTKSLTRRRPTKIVEKSSEIHSRSGPAKMNENLIRVVDSNHEYMISKVHVALAATTAENKFTEIPRSFASVDIGNRVKKIEEKLKDKMIDVFEETKTKLRSDQKAIEDQSTSKNTETEVSERPFRGGKRFHMTDLIAKTPFVAMSPGEFQRNMRVVRPTLVKPEQERRPTTKYHDTLDESKTSIRDAILSEERSVRQMRVKIKSIDRVEPTSTTTSSSIVNDVSDTQTEVTSTTVSAPTPTTVPITTTTPIPETTVSIEKIESSSISSEQTINLRAASPDKVETSNEDYAKDEKVNEVEYTLQNVIQDEPEHTVNEPTQNLNIEQNTSSDNPSNSDVSTDFKPLPSNFDVLSEQSPSNSDKLSDLKPLPSNSDVLSDFKPSPLWSLSSDEKDYFSVKEENHSYDMNMEDRERAFRRNNRQSRNILDAPVQYLNGFVPVSPLKFIGPIQKSSKLGDDALMRYNLPTVSKANFSKY